MLLRSEEVAGYRADDQSARHRLVIADAGDATVDALRQELHRLVADEQVAPFRIAVLVGCAMDRSLAWKQRTFGNQVLVNEAFDDAGKLLGIAPDQLQTDPDEILCETIRRFKGLERDVVVLVELDATTRRLDHVLYAGLTRATTHLTVIAPPDLAPRFKGGGGNG